MSAEAGTRFAGSTSWQRLQLLGNTRLAARLRADLQIAQGNYEIPGAGLDEREPSTGFWSCIRVGPSSCLHPRNTHAAPGISTRELEFTR